MLLERFKEAIIAYGICSTFVKQMLNSWATHNRIISQDQKGLVTAILEADPQLQQKTWWREEARVLEQHGRARTMEIFQEGLLGEAQFRLDDHTLVLCHTAVLNAWDRVEESGKRTEQFTKVIQGPKKPSLFFFFTKIYFSCKQNDIRSRNQTNIN